MPHIDIETRASGTGGASHLHHESHGVVVRPSLPDFDRLRLEYRLARNARTSAQTIMQGLVNFGRIHLTAWNPNAEKAIRKLEASKALRAVKAGLRDHRPEGAGALPDSLHKNSKLQPGDQRISFELAGRIGIGAPAWWDFTREYQLHRSYIEEAAAALPGAAVVDRIAGFSLWGLGTIVCLCGDITDDIVPVAEREPGKRYSGVRRLYKRLGMAPKEVYPTGEKKTGHKVPRETLGIVMGTIADPLLRAQWRGETDERPAHAVGPYGLVYGEAKARHLAAGRNKLHADRLARRAIVKAVIHDVHKAWHGQPLTYADRPV